MNLVSRHTVGILINCVPFAALVFAFVWFVKFDKNGWGKQ